MNLLIIMFYLVSQISIAYSEGTIDGGGSDIHPPDFGAAWFMKGKAKRVIHTCIKQDPLLFDIDQEIIKSEILEGMRIWKNYIHEKKIYEQESYDDVDMKLMEYVTDIQFKECEGNEDLTIYLGVEDKLVKKIRSRLYNPRAFAYKTAYDKHRGWGKGILWLSSSKSEYGTKNLIWKYGRNLRGIILHELGHILGVGHKNSTIMSPNFHSHLLQGDTDTSSDYYKEHYEEMGKIDWKTELVECLMCYMNTKGNMWISGSNHEQLAYQLLTGERNSGGIQTELSMINIQNHDQYQQINLQLKLINKNLEKVFPIVIDSRNISLKDDTTPLFKRFRIYKEPNSNTEHFVLLGTFKLLVSQITGYLELPDKSKLTVALDMGFSQMLALPPIGETTNEQEWFYYRKPVALFALKDGNKYHLVSNIEKMITKPTTGSTHSRNQL